jgi:DinB superfamily
MDASELLQKNNLMVIQVVDGFPEAGWDMSGACGEWSVKDIIAHLASYEHVATDVLNTFQAGEPSPILLKFLHNLDEFNDAEVAAREYLTAQQVMDEYQDTQVEATSLLMQIPDDKVKQIGTMPWYNQNTCLADFVYLLNEHTREHCLQIAQFRRKIMPEIGEDASAS